MARSRTCDREPRITRERVTGPMEQELSDGLSCPVADGQLNTSATGLTQQRRALPFFILISVFLYPHQRSGIEVVGQRASGVPAMSSRRSRMPSARTSSLHPEACPSSGENR